MQRSFRSLFRCLEGGVFVAVLCLFTSEHATGQTAPVYRVTLLDRGTGTINPRAINNNGQVAGFDDQGAFIYSAGTYTNLPNPVSPQYSTYIDINDRGQAVVCASPYSGSTEYHGYLYSDGKTTELPGCPTAINGAGEVIGIYNVYRPWLELEQWQVYRYRGGTVTNVDIGSLHAWPADFNDSGEIVGTRRSFYYENAQAFLFKPERGFIDLGVFGGFDSEAIAINQSGQIAGNYVSGDSSQLFLHRGFLHTGGHLVDIGSLGGMTFVRAINASGQITGSSDLSPGPPRTRHAFLYSGGVMRDLNSLIDPALGIELYDAFGINDGGEIVATSYSHGPNAADPAIWRAYLLSPIPAHEDSTPPVITFTIGGSPGTNGWYKGDVTVSWVAQDPESFIASSSGCSTTVLLADTPGTTLTCTAMNHAGLSRSASVTIRIDKTPPALAGMPAAGACALTPADHRLVGVATVSASDALSGMSALNVTGTSNEPASGTGPGDLQPDIVIDGTGTGVRTIKLRAEANPSSGGRVYTLTGTATDQAGNSTTATRACTVASGCSANVTSLFTITRGGFRLNRLTNRYIQTLTIVRNSATTQPLTGPFALALDGLSSNATLYHPAGTTACSLPAGSPYVLLNPGAAWSPGQSLTISLEFMNASNTGISYTTRVLAGSAGR